MIKILFIIGIILFFGHAHAQITFSFDTYNTNDNLVEEIFSSDPIDSGVTYCMQITGTYSIWSPSYWTNPCGIIETSPIYQSPLGNMTGNVGFDFEYKFSYPNSSTCAGETFPAPATPFPRMEITLDNGVSWFHPITSTPFNANHSYLYEIIGQGYPIGIRQNSPLNSDDYGVLKFTMYENEYCDSISDSLIPAPSYGVTLNMPNVFSPNNDQINDVFQPINHEGISSGNLLIYNRWGQLMHSNTMFSGWNGEYKGKQCSEGTYFWIINYTDLSGNEHEAHGFLTLTR
ncbi:MAG: gliding motility-associated C-terminal domain-containing protein [Crocinitomicaceae bacterium]|nr:gliding motility-associated C-terminal domain-containing protein [Crocinitomicaceae bacterium]